MIKEGPRSKGNTFLKRTDAYLNKTVLLAAPVHGILAGHLYSVGLYNLGLHDAGNVLVAGFLGLTTMASTFGLYLGATEKPFSKKPFLWSGLTLGAAAGLSIGLPTGFLAYEGSLSAHLHSDAMNIAFAIGEGALNAAGMGVAGYLKRQDEIAEKNK